MSTSPQLPAYIYGLHDVGGQDLMLAAGRPGWVLDTVDLRSQAGTDYTSLVSAGLGVIVRLNHGSGNAGSLPPSNQYDVFAAGCSAYVARSPGAHIWIIGNAMNSPSERPLLPDGTREVITPGKYAQCFLKCRTAIKNLPDHTGDWVIPGAVEPYNSETTYPGNATGDWVQYLVDVINLLPKQIDGIALHCHTHDLRNDEIDGEQMMSAPFDRRHYNFRAYRDFLNSVPETVRSLPVLITETNPVIGWRDGNTGWISKAYREIDEWNSDPSHQRVQALVLFRWQTTEDHPEWGIGDKEDLVTDFRNALAAGYRTMPPTTPPKRQAAPATEFNARWLKIPSVPNSTMKAGATVNGKVIVKNVGTKQWDASGPNPVRLGFHWYNERTLEVPVAPYGGNWPLPKDVPPAGTVTFESVDLRAPQVPGTFTLKWDLVQEGVTWFSKRGSPTSDSKIKVTGGAPLPAPSIPVTVPAPSLTPAPVASAEMEFAIKPVEIPTNAPVSAVVAAPEIGPEPVVQTAPLKWTSPTRGPWSATFLAHDTPISMVAGAKTNVNLRVKNSGENRWQKDGNPAVYVGYKWLNQAGQQQDAEDKRTSLPADIGTNEEAAFGVLLAAPSTPGSYSLRWDLVAEGETWFADEGNPPLVVPVLVTASPCETTDWRAESNLNPGDVGFALDGNEQTFWDSRVLQDVGQWYRLTLPSPRPVDGIQVLSPGKGAAAGYCLRVSGDGKEWFQVAAAESGNTYDIMAVFAPLAVKYVQIDLTAPPPKPSNWLISEILVHSAASWFATASHNNNLAVQAIDNRIDTAWSSRTAQIPGMWFQVDLGRLESISGLALYSPRDEDPANFRVATWDAKGNRWQVVYETANNAAAAQIEFAPTQTQFINIQILKGSSKPWAIQELRVVREMESWLGPGV